MRSLRLFAVVPLLALSACSGGDDDAAPTDSTATSDTVATDPDTDTAADTSDTTTPAASTDAPETTTAPTESSVPATTTDDDEADGGDLAVVAASLTPAQHVPLAALVTLELDAPAQVQLVATADGHQVSTPFTADAATSVAVPLVGLRSDLSYDVAVNALADGDEGELQLPEPLVFDTPPLPEWMPAHTVVSDPTRVSPGITIIESSPNDLDPDGEQDPAYPTNVAIGYDEEGEIVWYYTNQGLGGIEQGADGTFLSHYGPFGARQFDVLGNVVGHWRPSFADGNGTRNPGVLPDGNTGDAEAVTVDAEWTELRSFHHEVRTMPNGNLLALSTALHELTPAQQEAICPGDEVDFKAVSDVIIEFTPEGEAIRSWDLFDVVDVVDVPGTDMCATDGGLFASQENRDWTHANSVTYDPLRDAILISSRHTEQIIALDHLEGVGPQAQLRWIIGDGATIPLDGDPPFHQHAVEMLDDGSFIFYDNGNDRPGTAIDDPVNPTYSRAAIYDVDDSSDDPSEWSATQVWEHVDFEADGSPVFTSFIGDADILANGNVLITHGGIGPFPPRPEFPLRALIVEVVRGGDADGDVVWQLDSDPFQSHTVYRSEKVESFYVGDHWSTE